jgi:hypothetical protein
MNAKSCNEVREQLDLLAADAYEPAERAALENHLRDCPACAVQFAECQRLVGMIDLHWPEVGIERLRQRIDQQAKPRPRFRPFVRGVLAAAAMILIALSMVWWLPSGTTEKPQPSLALVVHGRSPAPGPEKLPAVQKDNGAKAVAVIPLLTRGKDLKDELIKARNDGKLPLPPAIALELEIVNTGKHALEVGIGHAAPTLELNLPVDSVIRIPVADAEAPEYLRPRQIRLEAGKKYVLHVDRLIAGSRGKLEYIYVTKPGEHLLTAKLHLTANAITVSVTAEPVRIKVSE